MTAETLVHITQNGRPEFYHAFVLGAELSGLALVIWDARGWPWPVGRKIGFWIAVFFGGLAGSAIADWFSGGILHAQGDACAIAPKTIIGGLLFGFWAAALYKRALGLTTPTSDAFARGTCWMMAVGRIGCYFFPCCFGRATTSWWGINFGDGIPRIPTQIIEAVLLFLIFIGLNIAHARRMWPDRRLFLLFIAYGLTRFGMEFLREPVSWIWMGWTYYQWLSLLLVLVGAMEWRRRYPVEAAA